MIVQEKEDLLQAIINNSDDGIGYYEAIRDKNGRVVDFTMEYLNDSAMKYLKGNKESFLGKPILECFPFNLVSGLQDAFIHVCETGIPINEIFHNTEGEYKGWYKNTIIKYSNGILVYFNNVTEHMNRDNELRHKNDTLQALMEEKIKVLKHNELLLREIHHRVKNNLQIISSLLSLQASVSGDEHTVEALKIAKQRVSTVAAVHEQLYQNRELDRIPLPSLINDILSLTSLVYGQVHSKASYRMKIEPVMLDISSAVNISLILNELITNSYKYGLNGHDPCILIEAHAADKGIKLTVMDNGPGIPKDFDLKQTNTLGLTLVDSLVEQMDGKLVISSEGGAVFRMHFPRVGTTAETA